MKHLFIPDLSMALGLALGLFIIPWMLKEIRSD